ncbi:MAG: hypothetical protein AAGA92_07775 [Planctomycetota bacterium]
MSVVHKETTATVPERAVSRKLFAIAELFPDEDIFSTAVLDPKIVEWLRTAPREQTLALLAKIVEKLGNIDES